MTNSTVWWEETPELAVVNVGPSQTTANTLEETMFCEYCGGAMDSIHSTFTITYKRFRGVTYVMDTK